MEKEKIISRPIYFILLLLLLSCSSNEQYKVNQDISNISNILTSIENDDTLYYKLKASLSIRISINSNDSICEYFDTTFKYSEPGSSIVMLTETKLNERSFNEFNLKDFDCERLISGPDYLVGDSVRIYKTNHQIIIERNKPKIDFQDMSTHTPPIPPQKRSNIKTD